MRVRASKRTSGIVQRSRATVAAMSSDLRIDRRRVGPLAKLGAEDVMGFDGGKVRPSVIADWATDDHSTSSPSSTDAVP